ncbi:MAG: FHA domain-containing protein, partial [bacterium]
MPRVTITIAEKGPQPYRVDLKREIVTIGRGLDNDIVVACGSVSGKHSEMRRVEGGYHLIDVGSTNGIKVDGVRQQKVSLKNGM